MRNTNHFIFRIKEQNSLAVSLLDHQSDAGNIGDKGVVPFYLKVFRGIFLDNMNFYAMYLVGGNKPLGIKACFYPLPVFQYVFRVITYAKGNILGVPRRRADTTLSIEYSMEKCR
jgi:hypothetical protein